MLGPKLLLKRRYGGDDDAFDDTSALRTLLALTDGLPVSLAVVPEPAVDRLAERLSHHSDITVLQHGFAHRNHAPAEEKKTEYGRHRLGSEVSVENHAWKRPAPTPFSEINKINFCAALEQDRRSTYPTSVRTRV